MPSFPHRKAELADRLAGTPVEPIERVRIAAVLDDVLSVREAALTMVTVMVADEGTDPLAKDYADALNRFGSQMNSKWNDMLSGLSTPSDGAVKFRERILVEEAGFWGAPGLAKLVDARDDLVLRARTFREMSAALDKKWASFTEEDARVDQAEEEAAKRVQELIRKAIDEEAALMARLGNSVSELLQAMSKLDDKVNEWAVAFAVGIGVPPNLAALIPKMSSLAQGAFDAAKTLGIPAAQLAAALAPILLKDPGFAAVEWFKTAFGPEMREILSRYSDIKKGLQYALQEQYVQHTATYRSILPAEGAILVTFTATRAEVDRFLQANNTEIARRNLDAALADLDRLRDGAPTDGQRADAALVRNEVRDSLNRRLTALSADWNAMFARHEGRFMGPLSGATEQELLEPDRWQVTVNGLVALGLDEKLRDWRRQSVEFQARIGTSFQSAGKAFDGLPEEFRAKIKDQINDYLTQTLRTLNSEAEDAARALEQSALMVNARKIEQDFDRSSVREKLRN